MIDSVVFVYGHNIPLKIHNVKYIISWLLIKDFYKLPAVSYELSAAGIIKAPPG